MFILDIKIHYCRSSFLIRRQLNIWLFEQGIEKHPTAYNIEDIDRSFLGQIIDVIPLFIDEAAKSSGFVISATKLWVIAQSFDQKLDDFIMEAIRVLHAVLCMIRIDIREVFLGILGDNDFHRTKVSSVQI